MLKKSQCANSLHFAKIFIFLKSRSFICALFSTFMIKIHQRYSSCVLSWDSLCYIDALMDFVGHFCPLVSQITHSRWAFCHLWKWTSVASLARVWWTILLLANHIVIIRQRSKPIGVHWGRTIITTALLLEVGTFMWTAHCEVLLIAFCLELHTFGQVIIHKVR